MKRNCAMKSWMHSRRFPRLTIAGLQMSIVILFFTASLSSVSSLVDNRKPIQKGDIFGAASENEAVSIAEPNIGALLGLGGSLAGNPASLLHSLGSHSIGMNGGGAGFPGVPNLQAINEVRNLCNSANAGNSDALTNLLVYQYLSGSIPAGSAPPSNGAATAAVNAAASAAAVRAAAVTGNPQLQALLEGSPESKTSEAITTTITTRTVTLEASTKFTTSTTSYVTTITTLTSSVLPIIFRGSKITTTITDRITDVLTATEFFTSSSVLTPSIIQTLPVEVTLLQTSTRGLNGHYTLAQVTPGATKIIEQPISSANVDFDTKGLDLSTLDLSTIDLSGLRGGFGQNGDAQMVNALSALLQKYSEDSSPQDKGSPRNRDRDRNRNSGNTRFHGRGQDSPNGDDDPPKFNVIKGFTLSDRPASGGSNSNSGSSGTALENTRYSKFRKKNDLENNSLRASEADRESERFSASTSRRTVSRANDRADRRRDVQSSLPSSRFHSSSSSSPTGLTGRSISGGRANRQTDRRQDKLAESSRKRAMRTLNTENANFNKIVPSQTKDRISPFKTTVLTLHISGVKPGQIITTTRTITLRGLATARIRRHIVPTPTENYPEEIMNTAEPDLTSSVQPEEIVKLLKGLDRSKVKEMLHSLQNWVDYYVHQVLDETNDPSFFLGGFQEVENNILELSSSKLDEEFLSSRDATTELNTLPDAISGEPSASSSSMCPKFSTVTETIYQTLFMSEL